MMRVFGQFAAVASTCEPASRTPSITVCANAVVFAKSPLAALFMGYTDTDLPAACVRTASTKACPTPPTPGGSPVPRAKTTSTSEQGSAEAAGIGAAIRDPATAAPATTDNV